MISARFQLWYKPKVEQAGAQPGRGCEEQILTIRLLIDIARKCRHTLYIAFVNYQAYDKVNRNKLLSLLQAKGCGTTFKKAIAASFSQVSGLIGSEKFSTSAGVRQGASTSCPLFTFVIDPTVDAVATDGPDGWLDTLHSLLLMDDTVVFATSRERLVQKLTQLKQCTDDLGMVIHSSNSQFLVINDDDTRPIMIDTITISHTDRYVYLGIPIRAKSIAAQVKDHLKSKAGLVLKFLSFLAKNTDAHFSVKQTVWESALNSAIFYRCETWMTSNLKAAESVYSSTLKQQLRVRATTCNDFAILEAGVTRGFDVLFDLRRNKWLSKQSRRRCFQTPLHSLWRYCNEDNVRVHYMYPDLLIKNPHWCR